MELYQLKTFLAVATERNLTRAAERVFTSVPAVSAQIKALEEELGVKLFERSARGMTLTPAGEQLSEEARRTLDAAHRLRSTAAQLRGELQGVLRMGSINDPMNLRLGEVFVLLAQRHPKLALQLQQGLSLGVMNALRSGDLDCAYLFSTQDHHEGLQLDRLSRVEVVVALPRRGPWSEQSLDMDLATLARQPWIGLAEHCGMRPILEQLFLAAGCEPPGGLMADAHDAVRGMVAAGLGLGLLRRDQAEAAQQAGELMIWPHWQGQGWICWAQREDAPHRPQLQALRALVLEVWAR